MQKYHNLPLFVHDGNILGLRDFEINSHREKLKNKRQESTDVFGDLMCVRVRVCQSHIQTNQQTQEAEINSGKIAQ